MAMTTNMQIGAVPQCQPCAQSPSGETGHAGLSHYVGGPYPGQNIFKCAECDDRWIRHYGGPEERFAWTRFVHTRPRNRNAQTRASA
jgi:hypothetical protein